MASDNGGGGPGRPEPYIACWHATVNASVYCDATASAAGRSMKQNDVASPIIEKTNVTENE
jgi:hypothetical protein